ncbi:hypothetical protein Ciccas_002614, partial [Cichlidogyrus casuarinus]
MNDKGDKIFFGHVIVSEKILAFVVQPPKKVHYISAWENIRSITFGNEEADFIFGPDRLKYRCITVVYEVNASKNQSAFPVDDNDPDVSLDESSITLSLGVKLFLPNYGLGYSQIIRYWRLGNKPTPNNCHQCIDTLFRGLLDHHLFPLEEPHDSSNIDIKKLIDRLEEENKNYKVLTERLKRCLLLDDRKRIEDLKSALKIDCRALEYIFAQFERKYSFKRLTKHEDKRQEFYGTLETIACLNDHDQDGDRVQWIVVSFETVDRILGIVRNDPDHDCMISESLIAYLVKTAIKVFDHYEDQIFAVILTLFTSLLALGATRHILLEQLHVGQESRFHFDTRWLFLDQALAVIRVIIFSLDGDNLDSRILPLFTESLYFVYSLLYEQAQFHRFVARERYLEIKCCLSKLEELLQRDLGLE